MLVLLEMIPLASRSGTWRKRRLSGSRDRRLEVAPALHRRAATTWGSSVKSRPPEYHSNPARRRHANRSATIVACGKYLVPLSVKKATCHYLICEPPLCAQTRKLAPLNTLDTLPAKLKLLWARARSSTSFSAKTNGGAAFG